MIQGNYLLCDGDKPGLGLSSCIPNTGYPIGGIKVPRNWSLDTETDTFDFDYIKGQVQQGNFFSFVGSDSYDNNTPETVTQEFDSGSLFSVRNGKVQFMYRYVKPRIWHALASKHNGNNEGAWIFIYENGTALVQYDGTKISGFKLNMFNVPTFKDQTGSETNEAMLTIQLKDEIAYNQDFWILTKETLGFDISDDVPVITDLNLKLSSPITAGSDAVVDVAYSVNAGASFSGLELANLRLIVNGSSETFTISESPVTKGQYTITPDTAFAADDEVYVQTYDATNSVSVADFNGALLRGTSNKVTVTA